MDSLAQPILVGVLVAVFTTLVTFTITVISGRGAIEKSVTKGIKVHEQVNHKDSLYTYVQKEIADHKADCNAPVRLRKIEKVVMAIYVQQGGRIEDLDI